VTVRVWRIAAIVAALTLVLTPAARAACAMRCVSPARATHGAARTAHAHHTGGAAVRVATSGGHHHGPSHVTAVASPAMDEATVVRAAGGVFAADATATRCAPRDRQPCSDVRAIAVALARLALADGDTAMRVPPLWAAGGIGVDGRRAQAVHATRLRPPGPTATRPLRI
jgi:hypothetical protein